MLCIHHWIPKATASAMNLFGPWPDPSMSLVGVICLCLILVAGSAALGVESINIVPNIRRGGRPRHQVPAMGVGTHHKQICNLCRA
jgi:hypothetical protein